MVDTQSESFIRQVKELQKEYPGLGYLGAESVLVLGPDKVRKIMEKYEDDEYIRKTPTSTIIKDAVKIE